tara:strand:- start:21216 stop:21440 length:225 start_codon:yes stop_codon:yes gene_type:complete
MFKNNPWLNEYYDKMINIFKSTQTQNENKKSEQEFTDYSTFKVVDLKAEAKSRGFKGYTRLKKSELIDLLNENQ